MSYLRPNNDLLAQVASELESMRCLPLHDGVEFPMTARALLYSLPGNTNCVDCGALHPQWASVSFGALMCLQCSGKHRSYGVQTSFVRSVDMDTWSHAQVLSMLEGGNSQLISFFDRHRMGNSTALRAKRYHTKAAKFYRTNLAKHAQDVSASGVYMGREASRQKHYDSDESTESQPQREAVQQEQHCSPPTLQPQQRIAVQ